MNINDIRIGNLLVLNNKIVEVISVNPKNGLIYTDYSPAPFTINYFRPLYPNVYNKGYLIADNAKCGFDTITLELQMRGYPLHKIQNRFYDIYNTPFVIDVFYFCLMQQDI